MSNTKEVHLDGSYLEGGGQLLRLAVGLAALTHTPLRVTSIRANRRGKSGLKLQHLRAVQFLATVTQAECQGAEVGSKQITFTPTSITTESRTAPPLLPKEIQIGSPGSVCLVIQAILPYLLFAGSRHALDQTDSSTTSRQISIKIRGGTNVSNSPSIEYLQHVLIPTLAKIGLSDVKIAIHERGWTGRGIQIGAVTLSVVPLGIGKQLPMWSLTERGSIKRIEVYAVMSKRHASAIEQQTTVLLQQLLGSEIEIETQVDDNPNIFYLLVVAISENRHRLGRDWLYDGSLKRDQSQIPIIMAKRVIQDLAIELKHGGCVDHYMRDQLIVFQALSIGKCNIDYGHDEQGPVEPSLHVKTAAWVTEEIIGVQWKDYKSCQGIGFTCDDDDDDDDSRSAADVDKVTRDMKEVAL